MTSSLNKPPVWYWCLSVIALVWYGLSVFQYLSQAFYTENFQEKYTTEQLELMSNAPIWAIVAFAVAAFFGLLGSFALLAKKKWAYSMFIVSFAGVAIEMFYNFYILKSIAIYGSSAIILTVLIVTFAITFVLFSKIAINKKWIV